MSKLFSFENLNVWVLSKELLKDIYLVTKTFGKQDQFVLGNQLNKAALSVTSNLAEGSGPQICKDQARFSEIAYGSMMEIIAQLQVAKDLGLLQPDNYKLLREVGTDYSDDQ